MHRRGAIKPFPCLTATMVTRSPAIRKNRNRGWVLGYCGLLRILIRLSAQPWVPGKSFDKNLWRGTQG
jgi:hypothetical protein